MKAVMKYAPGNGNVALMDTAEPVSNLKRKATHAS
jgi:hypothetical protein